MGQKIVLTDTFTDATLPKLFEDGGMSDGTLFLFDPSHSLGAFTGIPANGASVPNVAKNKAAQITGAAASTLDGTVSLSQESPSALRLERTTKGGVHGLPSQVNQTTSSNGWTVSLPTAIRDYIFNNIDPGGHGLYASMWLMKTRDYGSANIAPQSPFHIHNLTSAASNYLFFFQNLDGGPSSGGTLLGRTTQMAALNTPGLLAIGVSGWKGTKPGAASSQRQEFGVGLLGSWGGLNVNKGPGLVLYRLKLEDLYLTKRANGGAGGTLAEEYAAALAQDQADFATAFGVGGKFYGDTVPTSPASFP